MGTFERRPHTTKIESATSTKWGQWVQGGVRPRLFVCHVGR